MWQVLIPFGTALLGVVGTILAYQLNPKNQAQKQYAEVMKEIAEWEGKRDEALVKNDSDGLSVANSKLSGLRLTEAALFKRL